MTGTGQLESEPEADGDMEASEADRRLWEAREENAELRARLAEQLERERILELEIAAVRKDLEVKVAYSEALDKSADERQTHVEWLQAHFDAERKRADDATADLKAERSRIYYRLAQPLVRVLRGRTRP